MHAFFDNKYFKIAIYSLCVIIISIFFYRISSNSDNIIPSMVAFFDNISGILSPILYGLLIAYLLNPIMCFFEDRISSFYTIETVKQKRLLRTSSIMIVYLCTIGLLVVLVRYLIPQILTNIRDLMNMLPTYIDEFRTFITNMEKSVTANLAIIPPELLASIFEGFTPEKLFQFSAVGGLVTKVVSQAFGFTSALINCLMAIVISFYALQQKEAFAYGAKRLIYCIFKKTTATRIVATFSEAHEMFIKFFVGKFIDSFIIGTICFIGLKMLGNHYALLLSVIVGIFNMIPYFGPFLGGIPAVLITLFDGFLPALTVAGFILILQQFDGLVLGPKILGDSIGLSPFWIISGIIIGGALWGPLGMFFASPLIAAFFVSFNRWMDKTLSSKGIDLPNTTLPEE